jgi:Zn-dependent peptidase ImmA (M78 family)
MFMTFYENKNEQKLDAVFNDEGYLVVHWTYQEALEKFKKLYDDQNWMVYYLNRLKKKKEKKFIFLMVMRRKFIRRG